MSNNFPFRINPLQRSNIGRQIRRGICDNTDNECNFFFFFPTTIDRRDPRQDADGRRGTLTVHGHERQEDCRVLRRSRRRRMNEGFRGLVSRVRLRSQVRSCSLPSRLTALIYLFATRFIVEQFSYIIRT